MEIIEIDKYNIIEPDGALIEIVDRNGKPIDYVQIYYN